MLAVLLLLAAAAPAGGARTIKTMTPHRVEAGKAHKLSIVGKGFREGDKVYLDRVELPTEYVSTSTIIAKTSSLAAGNYAITVGRPRGMSFPSILSAYIKPLRFAPQPKVVTVKEDERLELDVHVMDDEPARVYAVGLPPGAHWFEKEKKLVFKPDFIQGGRKWKVNFSARDATRTATASFVIDIQDTIKPVEPLVEDVDHATPTITKLLLEQRTDAFTSAAPWLEKSYPARVCVPEKAKQESKMPVRIFLHGAEATEIGGPCSEHEFRVYPADPDTTYWWGYGGAAPANYTARRVLQLVSWVLESFPGADAERVYLVGTSMGGAGALAIGLLNARHFAYVESYWAQSIPRHHRPGRLKTLHEIWGPPPQALDRKGKNPWDLLDVTRILGELPSAREQFIFTRHGKDDPVIHFGAAVMKSKLTGHAFYEMLENVRLGHYVVWDEAGHGSPDPVMGKHWWDSGWDPIHDERSFLRRDRAFPAYARSSANEDAGTGMSRAPRPLDPTRGYAGVAGSPGDTGWDGALAGAQNRWLRWDATKTVDTVDKLAIPLFHVAIPGGTAVKAGYPTKKDARVLETPIRVTVTPRRVQNFQTTPGEKVRWKFGDASGEAFADLDGAVTVPDLAVTNAPTMLVIERL